VFISCLFINLMLLEFKINFEVCFELAWPNLWVVGHVTLFLIASSGIRDSNNVGRSTSELGMWRQQHLRHHEMLNISTKEK
jgi:hypothetical protein